MTASGSSAQVRSHGKPGQVGEGHPSCSHEMRRVGLAQIFIKFDVFGSFLAL
jgi:hypothetical protein